MKTDLVVRFARRIVFALGTMATATSIDAAALQGPESADRARLSDAWGLQVTVPDLTHFVARATLALDPGAHVYRRGAASPFTLFDRGAALSTQCDLVARHGDGSAALVELSARVERGTRRPGSRIELRVDKERPSDFAIVEPGALAWKLLTAKASVALRAADFHGNVYAIPLSFGTRRGRAGSGARRPRGFHRIGPAQVTAEASGALRPLKNADTALETFGWVQHWATVRGNSNVVQLIINWHNGGVGAGASEALHFESLELSVPEGWAVLSEYPLPAMEAQRSGESKSPNVFLIQPNPDGRLHLLPQNRQTAFRLTLYPASDATARREAEAYNANAGAGSCPESFRGSRGRGWGVERYPLPDLAHVGDLSRRVRARESAVRGAFEKGVNPSELGGDDTIGPYHVWGPKYGGVTGGSEKDAILGMEEACAGVPEGALWLRMRMDATANRMDDFALYRPDGQPVRLSAHARPNGSAPWKYFDRWGKRAWPDRALDADLPWGWSEVEARHVIPEERRAKYADRIAYDPPKNTRGYQAIDGQHYSRWYAPCHALLFLDNDPLARRNLLMSATLARMTYWEGAKGRLFGMARPKVKGIGGALGRGEAQMLSAACIGWLVAGDNWRREFAPFFGMWADALEANLTRSGVLSGSSSGKLIQAHGFDKRFRVCRANPQSVLMNALRGLVKGPLSSDQAASQRVERILAKLGAVGLWEHLWAKSPDGERRGGTWTHVAIGPIQPESSEDMFPPGEHPPEQFAYATAPGEESKQVPIDRFRTCLGLGVYFDLVRGTDDEQLAWKMLRQHLGEDPLGRLEGERDRFAPNRYGLLGMLQAERDKEQR